MELSPVFYHKFIRPKWITQIYIHNIFEKHIKLNEKNVLDFGAGTGANCTLCRPGQYIGIDPDEKRIGYAKSLYPECTFEVLQRIIGNRRQFIDGGFSYSRKSTIIQSVKLI